MHLIVGLGNPGEKYSANRHNVGFLAVDRIAQRHSFPPFRNKFKGLLTEGSIGNERVLLLKPQTFMNSSGESVEMAAQFYKIGVGSIAVIYDEIDLAPGKVRIKSGGGSGGHNGIRSISPRIGNDFRRIRVGVGHPGNKDAVMPWVLGDFSRNDRQWLDPLLSTLAENARMIVDGDDNGLMNKLALATQELGSSAAPASETARESVAPASKGSPEVHEPTGPLAEVLGKMFGRRGRH